MAATPEILIIIGSEHCSGRWKTKARMPSDNLVNNNPDLPHLQCVFKSRAYHKRQGKESLAKAMLCVGTAAALLWA